MKIYVITIFYDIDEENGIIHSISILDETDADLLVEAYKNGEKSVELKSRIDDNGEGTCYEFLPNKIEEIRLMKLDAKKIEEEE